MKPATVEIEEFETVAIVWMKQHPVNTMTMDMWTQLADALRHVESNPRMQGIAFLSGVSKDVFTAGNDIGELYAPNTTLERYTRFWTVSNTFLADLYTSRLVTIAGIRGACPAGGCCLALCCDYRIMTEEVGYIGLNEVALGIHVPKYWGMLMEKAIGSGPAAKLLQFATLLSSHDAKSIGLVDELCPKKDLKQRVIDRLSEHARLPGQARWGTKMLLRRDFVDAWMAYIDDEATHAWSMLSSSETVDRIATILEKLTTPRSKM